MVITYQNLRGAVSHVSDHVVKLGELISQMAHSLGVHIPLLELVRDLNQLIHHRVIHMLKLGM